MKRHTLSTVTPLLVASSPLLLSACSSSDDDDITNANPQTEITGEDGTNQIPGEDGTNQMPGEDGTGMNPPIANSDTIEYGYVFTRGPNYESGQIERISLTDGNTVDGTYRATKSDHRLATNDESLFQIGRFAIDNLTRFSASDTSVVDYQLSVRGDEPETSNPQSLAFIDDDLAYLTRRSSDKLLIIDPSPEELTSESLITGEISLADYNRGSADTLDLPDMTDAVIVDDKLFVLLENLDGFAPVNTGYIAVIDTRTNLEIQTEKGDLPLKGIKLQTVNPTGLQYNEATGLLYVVGRGNAFGNESAPGDPYTGGLESIDPQTYQTNLLVDDGTEEDNKGFFSSAVVVTDTLGYVITLDGFDADFNSINNLRTFNPSTGEVSEPVAGTEGQSLTNLAVGPDDHLWVGIQDDTPGFMRIDIATGILVADRVATTLIPADLVFIEVDRQ